VQHSTRDVPKEKRKLATGPIDDATTVSFSLALASLYGTEYAHDNGQNIEDKHDEVLGPSGDLALEERVGINQGLLDRVGKSPFSNLETGGRQQDVIVVVTSRRHLGRKPLGPGTLVGEEHASHGVDDKGDGDANNSGYGVLPVIPGHGHCRQMSSASNQEHVRNNVIVVS